MTNESPACKSDETPPGCAIGNIPRAAHDESASTHLEALQAFVDAFQALVGSAETNKELAALVRALLMRMLRTLPEPLAVPASKNYRVTRILGYLEEQFADAMVCLASAARHVGVTPPHLDRLLKDHTGLPFLQHLRRIRMRYAERLLLLTNSSIKETAYACGYVASGSFGRDFKRTHGCAARAWRAQSTLTSVRELKEAQSRAR